MEEKHLLRKTFLTTQFKGFPGLKTRMHCGKIFRIIFFINKLCNEMQATSRLFDYEEKRKSNKEMLAVSRTNFYLPSREIRFGM